LMTREERLRSEDMGHYFRVAADNRDLNHGKFLVKGEGHTMADEAYTNHNTNRLDVAGTVKRVLTTDYVQEALKTWEENRACRSSSPAQRALWAKISSAICATSRKVKTGHAQACPLVKFMSTTWTPTPLCLTHTAPKRTLCSIWPASTARRSRVSSCRAILALHPRCWIP